MLSGGEALEAYAVRSASSVLHALAKRMPSVVHRRVDSRIESVELDDVRVGDIVLVFPHEICPIDGTVIGRAWGDGRILSDRRAVHDVQDSRFVRLFGCDQWRVGA